MSRERRGTGALYVTREGRKVLENAFEEIDFQDKWI
jgi:hypothetical protein